MQTITTTIKRQWLSEIIAGTKKIEYREAKPYWRNKLSAVDCPFELRMINGMRPYAPEVTVKIIKITESKKYCEFRLHIGKVLGWKNWDSKRMLPKKGSSK
jgi:hypothetical protein